MRLTLNTNALIVDREQGDKPYRRSERASAESTFLYNVNKELQKQYGLDLIKKRMWRDGHLVDDEQQYLRARNVDKVARGDMWAIYNGSYAVHDAGEEFTKYGTVTLRVERTEQ